MAVTKSGGSRFHGSAFEFHQDDSLKATQWGSEKSTFNKNNFGANIGGPIPVPGLTTEKWKSFFYFDIEGYRQLGGALSRCSRFRRCRNVKATSATGATPMGT